jgi:ABC transport system ATP-binding/permease protein
MMGRVLLTIESKAGRKEVLVGAGDNWTSFLIGRSSEADLFLNDPGVSRRHCRIFRRPRSIAVEDLGSRAGTMRNGQKVTRPIGLADGDDLVVGAITLRVTVEQVASEPTMETVPPLPPPLPTPPPSATTGAPDATVVARGGQIRPTTDPSIRRELRGRDVTTLGRDPGSDIVLPSPVVSRCHSELRWEGDGCLVLDMGSTNGTFVNGEQVFGDRLLRPGDRIGIGSFRLTFDGERITAAPPDAGTRIEVRDVGKEVIHRETGKPIHLLRNLDLTILPREFVGLLGSSGCGKSTFIDVVNGRRPATEGVVLFNGENLYNRFDSFKRGIGYVPQDLIFHDALPLHSVLSYASRIRLPDDTTDAEIEENIDRVLEIVGLTDKRTTLVSNLSGGQKKRVSIAMELLSRPTVLFLDEATSGLDLGTEAQMMKLFRGLADGGVTTMCITHYVDSLEMCDLVVYFVAGRLAYFGSPEGLKSYFGVEAIREVYLKESDKTPEEWESAFRESEAYATYVAGRASPTEKAEQTVVKPGSGIEQVRPSDPTRQLRVLIERHIKLLTSDRKSLFLMLGLAPLIGLLVSLVLSGGGRENLIEMAGRQGKLSFTLALVMFFLGVFGSIREVVKELHIYRHERFVNLEIIPYLLSKAIPLAVIGAIQTAEILIVVHLFADVRASIVGQFLFLFPTTVAAMLLGLTISSAVDTADKAVMFMILAVIPQLLFANAFIQIKGLGALLGMCFVLCYWTHDGLKSLLPDRLLEAEGFGGRLVLFGHQGWFPDFCVILLYIGLYGFLAYHFLRKKDGPYGRPYQIPWIRSGTWVEVKKRAAWTARNLLGKITEGVDRIKQMRGR